MRTENWCGYDIRFVEVNGEWYAILKDICDALGLRTDKVANRLDPSMIEGLRLRYLTTLQGGLDQEEIITLVGCSPSMKLESMRLCSQVVALKPVNSVCGPQVLCRN